MADETLSSAGFWALYNIVILSYLLMIIKPYVLGEQERSALRQDVNVLEKFETNSQGQPSRSNVSKI